MGQIIQFPKKPPSDLQVKNFASKLAELLERGDYMFNQLQENNRQIIAIRRVLSPLCDQFTDPEILEMLNDTEFLENPEVGEETAETSGTD